MAQRVVRALPVFAKHCLILGLIIAFVRLSAFSYLAYARITHTESLSSLPLVLFLLPEGLLFDVESSLLIYGLTLLVGSFLIAFYLVGLAHVTSRAAQRLPSRRKDK